jgi:hypothetical protein
MPFRHEPLDFEKNQIRLLQISPCAEDTVACRVEIFAHDDCPSYEALSYTWGDRLPVRVIKLNDGDFEVRENLWSFLKHVAERQITRAGSHDAVANTTSSARTDTSHGSDRSGPYYSPRYLWIDQICINQSATDERNHQVQLMSQIFNRASQVCTWLGEAADDSDAGMDFLASTANLVATMPHLVNADHFRQDLEAIREWFRGRGKEAQIIRAIFRRKYWYRLWIVQEFLLSRGRVLVCGHRYIEYEKIVNVLQALNGVDAVWHRGRDRIEQLWLDPRLFGPARRLLDDASLTGSNHQMSSLGEVLKDYSHLDCEDPRDKIYGLLGLVRTRERFDVDYSKTPSAIFWKALATAELGTWVAHGRRAVRRLADDMQVTGSEEGIAGSPAMERWKDIFGDRDPKKMFAR